MSMTDAEKLAVQEAKASTWKKVLIWGAVVLALVTIVTIVIVIVIKKKDPTAATKAIVDYAKNQTAKADLDAKIEVAKAQMVEEAVVAELLRIREIDDEAERTKRLAELL
jgi:hypothetical protein